jgi:HlyD family secretion protein
MTRRTGWVTGMVVVAGVAATVIGYGRSGKKADFTFETTKVDRGRIIAKVTATGTLSALVTVQVGSQVSGRISKLMADFNSPVKKGQVIAKIDPALFDAAVEQARANYVAGKGQLVKAKVQAVDARRQYDRAKVLAAQKLIAQQDLDTSQANADAADAAVAAAEGNLEQNKAALNQAEVNLEYTTIVSPTDGTVISRSVDVGQTVAASLSAPTLFTIAQDLKKMQVDTNVAEADVGRLRPGMPATFHVDAYPSDTFRGTIRQVRNAPQTVQSVVTYDAVIDVDNSDLKLKPGMTANVTFVYADKSDVMRVTNAALRFRPPPELMGDRHHGGPGGPSGAPGPSGPGGAGGGHQRFGQAGPGGGGHSRADAEGSGGAQAAGGEETTPDRRVVWLLPPGENPRPRPVRIRVGVSDGTLTEVTKGELSEGDPLVTEAVNTSEKPGGATAATPFRRGF